MIHCIHAASGFWGKRRLTHLASTSYAREPEVARQQLPRKASVYIKLPPTHVQYTHTPTPRHTQTHPFTQTHKHTRTLKNIQTRCARKQLVQAAVSLVGNERWTQALMYASQENDLGGDVEMYENELNTVRLNHR